MQVEERFDQGQMGVEEREGDIVLLVRRAAMAPADLRALRAVLAPVAGRVVAPPRARRRL
ncbi:hypothetical protein [Parafrankia sp. FMc2]|uniref:hypothetical protein n=1 Tax=Parafrankia sp. FMc2 TaxID=3233196 RepID=UPI0034D56CB6